MHCELLAAQVPASGRRLNSAQVAGGRGDGVAYVVYPFAAIQTACDARAGVSALQLSQQHAGAVPEALAVLQAAGARHASADEIEATAQVRVIKQDRNRIGLIL